MMTYLMIDKRIFAISYGFMVVVILCKHAVFVGLISRWLGLSVETWQ